ncbi:oligosaccharide flippase family protein [Pseudoalteromonas sp. 20-MNA-CIBAN-0454]|uniref:lipopolysaccharide biosynthesis protein n=1 Tax=Pseudoalteromonas sp. 20-MNA-CIBAN-0454 TaxID=3140424 RepID=UPI00331943F5
MKLNSSLLLASSQILTAVLGVLTLPLLTFFLEPSGVGRFSLIQSIIAISTMTFALGFEQAFFKFYKDSSSIISFSLPILISSIISSSLLVIVLFFFGNGLGFDSIASIFTIALVCLMFSYNRIFNLHFRLKLKSLLFFIMSVSQKIILLISASFIYTNDYLSYADPIIIFLISGFFCFLLALILDSENIVFFKFKLFYIDFQEIKKHLAFGFPLFISALLFWLLFTVDKLMIAKLVDMESLGFYSVIMAFSASGLLLQSIFNTVYLRKLYCLKKDDLKLFVKKVFCCYLDIVVLFYFIFIVIAYFAFLAMPEEYSIYTHFIPLSVLYSLIYALSDFASVSFSIYNRTHIGMIIMSLQVIFIVAMFSYFLPLYGLQSAFFILSFSFLLSHIARVIFASRFEGFESQKASIFYVLILCIHSVSVILISNPVYYLTSSLVSFSIYCWYSVSRRQLIKNIKESL